MRSVSRSGTTKTVETVIRMADLPNVYTKRIYHIVELYEKLLDFRKIKSSSDDKRTLRHARSMVMTCFLHLPSCARAGLFLKLAPW